MAPPPPSVLVAAATRRDLLRREKEELHGKTVGLLRERGFGFSRSLSYVDLRHLSPLDSEPKMRHSPAFLEHRAYWKKQNKRGSYLHEPVAVPKEAENVKRKTEEELALEAAQERADKVNERLKGLVDDFQVGELRKIRSHARKLDALGVYPHEINQTRAEAQVKADLRIRKTATMDEMRRLAAVQVDNNYRPPPPKAIEYVPTTAEILHGKLERLEHRLAHGPRTAAAPGFMSGRGSASQHGRSGSMSRKTTSRQSAVLTPAAAAAAPRPASVQFAARAPAAAPAAATPGAPAAAHVARQKTSMSMPNLLATKR